MLNKNTKYLISGSSGQLAREFIDYFTALGVECLAPDEAELDITSRENIDDAIGRFRPDVLLNCAAYNNVEQAEVTPEPAYAVNAVGVKNLAESCKANNVILVHYSTDYVFDGQKECFYVEDDAVNPLNEYGKSKLQGERGVQSAGCNYLILRLSWVYGPGQQNFIYKLQQWAQNRNRLDVVCDQVSIPTYTEDIVKLTLAALEKKLTGLYHLTNSGYASRYEVARFFFGHIGNGPELILPVTSDKFPSPVKRPFISILSNKKLATDLGENISTWQDALLRYSRRLSSTGD